MSVQGSGFDSYQLVAAAGFEGSSVTLCTEMKPSRDPQRLFGAFGATLQPVTYKGTFFFSSLIHQPMLQTTSQGLRNAVCLPSAFEKKQHIPALM